MLTRYIPIIKIMSMWGVWVCCTCEAYVACECELQPSPQGGPLEQRQRGHGQLLHGTHERPQPVHKGSHLCHRIPVVRRGS
jgi:hypothetical protein